MKWTPMLGNFDVASEEHVIFHGRTVGYQDPATKEIKHDGADFGVIVCDEPFSDGTIRVTVNAEDTDRLVAGICLESDLGRGRQVVASIGSVTGYLFAISEFDESKKRARLEGSRRLRCRSPSKPSRQNRLRAGGEGFRAKGYSAGEWCSHPRAPSLASFARQSYRTLRVRQRQCPLQGFYCFSSKAACIRGDAVLNALQRAV